MGREQAQPMEGTGGGRRPNGDDLTDKSMDGPDWSEYLTGAKHNPVSVPGHALSDLLGKPPALALIQHTKAKVPLYEGVPVTPPARQQFYRVQQTLE